MKPKRSLIITLQMVVLTVSLGFILAGCATTGNGKEAEPDTHAQAPGPSGDQSTPAAEEAGGGSPEAANPRVVRTTGSDEQARDATAVPESGADPVRQSAAYVLKSLERLLPGNFAELNWNRIATVVVGLAFMGMIYGLAFALGRLPAHRRSVAGRGGSG